MVPNPELSKARKLRTVVFAFGGVSFAFFIAAPQLSIWNAIALYAVLNLIVTNSILIFFVETRHWKLVRKRRDRPFQWRRQSRKDPRKGKKANTEDEEDEDYCLFVLGSGGHTKEMLMMMDDGSCDFHNLHRRYLVSSGDKMSVNHLEDYEEALNGLCEKKGSEPGTYDVRRVTRARRVHQSLLTTPLTALLSMVEIIFSALLTPPTHLVKGKSQYPRMVFSNGPATGFFVGLAIHLLKIIYIIPEDTCNLVYIESWARISTLSLTGKLFYYTGIADAFAVQHKEVAATYGVDYAGPIVFNARREIEQPQ